MKNWQMYVGVLVAGIILGYLMSRGKVEPFVSGSNCNLCNGPSNSCGCEKPKCNSCGKSGADIKCPAVDWSKYVLKASVPPCPPQPDLSRYMLKTECPAPPDMSRYILKSAVPVCPPCISTCNKPCKIGACPPCPPPQRCPVVTCPEPKSCPPCAPVEPPRCPEPKINCKAKYEPEDPWMVRPLMASISGM
jgi:hypothetical protein